MLGPTLGARDALSWLEVGDKRRAALVAANALAHDRSWFDDRRREGSATAGATRFRQSEHSGSCPCTRRPHFWHRPALRRRAGKATRSGAASGISPRLSSARATQ